MSKCIYLIGSLRNPDIPEIGKHLRERDWEVFDDWYSPGKEADDYWRDYSQRRGQTYQEALDSWAANHVFDFDRYHLDRCDIGLLVHPAGKSCHLELGYLIGQGKPSFIYWPNGEPPEDRWDVMVKFAKTAFSLAELLGRLEKHRAKDLTIPKKDVWR